MAGRVPGVHGGQEGADATTGVDGLSPVGRRDEAVSEVRVKSPLRRAIEALLPTGVLDERGAKAELGRLFGVKRQRVSAMVWDLRNPEATRGRWRRAAKRRYVVEVPVRCGVCREPGHNVRTCEEVG